MPDDRWPELPTADEDNRSTTDTGTAVLDPDGVDPSPNPRSEASQADERRLPAKRRRRLRVALAAAGAALFGLVSGYAMHDAGLQLSTMAPAEGAVLNAADADELIFRIEADLPSLMDTATLEYDGSDVMSDAHVSDGELVFRPADLTEGEHTLRFSIERPFTPWSRLTREWRFSVDTTRPRIEMLDPPTSFVRGAPATISGRVSEPARVTVAGTPVEVAPDGTFAHTMPEPPMAPVPVLATDMAGNERGVRADVPVVPRTPLEPTRAVHMTAISWRVDELREPVLDMLRRGQINTIQLDLKDEAGIVGYDSAVPFANRIGAVKPEYELADAVAQIHALGGRVIGRVVAFRDPVHARYAWENGMRDQVVQDPAGNPYAGYGGFTNFAHPAVQRYNVDVAREAAEAGVDDILYDYVRRPDGPIETMRFPGMKGTASSQIVEFLREADVALEPTGAFIGASLFGVAALQPEDIAQPVPAIARVVDYVAPMIYPSHWGAGSFDIANPNAMPYETVLASTRLFVEQTKGTGARVVPWLQDFSLGYEYGPEEVRAQIEAAADAGADEWIMWDALVTYTEGAYVDENGRVPADARAGAPSDGVSAGPGESFSQVTPPGRP
jgi:hypothetical protein